MSNSTGNRTATAPMQMQTAPHIAVCITFFGCVLTTVVIALVALGTTSCAAGRVSNDRLTEYAVHDVSYTVEFSTGSNADGASSEISPTGGISAIAGRCERRGTRTVMEVTSPERLRGISVIYDSGSGACVLGAGEAAIPLSPEVSGGLTELFDLLGRSPEDGGMLSKSADGENTVVTFSDADGSVTLDPEGIPLTVFFGERQATLKEYVVGAAEPRT